MKRKLIFILLLVISTVFYSSCERVIDIDIKDAAPRLVIEGVITNRTDSQYVKITRSAPIGELNEFPGVSGAVVTVTDDSGNEYNFRERMPGVYSSRRLKGTPGRTYALKVVFEGKEYTATSSMPSQVSLDSLGVSSTTIFDEEQKSVQLLYSDPPGRKNCYRFILYVNGVKAPSIFVFNDDFNDGKTVNRELFDLDLELKTADVVEIEMHCIDPVVFRYWQGLDQNQSRGGASTTPANPVTNLSNGALGYFSAHTQQIEVIRIP